MRGDEWGCVHDCQHFYSSTQSTTGGEVGGSSADLFMYVNVDIGLDGATLYEKVIHLNTGGFWQ